MLGGGGALKLKHVLIMRVFMKRIKTNLKSSGVSENKIWANQGVDYAESGEKTRYSFYKNLRRILMGKIRHNL